jgi:hypothetical protein
MAPVVWQRHHGADIVATVDTIDGSNHFTAATWLRSNPTVVVRHHRPIDNIDSAKIKADYLARATFNHVCTIEACGDWRFIP